MGVCDVDDEWRKRRRIKSCHRLKGPSASDRCHAGASPLGTDNVSPCALMHWTYLHVACTRDQSRADGTSCLAAMCINLHLDLDDFIYARALFRRFHDLLFWSFLGKIMATFVWQTRVRRVIFLRNRGMVSLLNILRDSALPSHFLPRCRLFNSLLLGHHTTLATFWSLAVTLAPSTVFQPLHAVDKAAPSSLRPDMNATPCLLLVFVFQPVPTEVRTDGLPCRLQNTLVSILSGLFWLRSCVVSVLNTVRSIILLRQFLLSEFI